MLFHRKSETPSRLRVNLKNPSKGNGKADDSDLSEDDSDEEMDISPVPKGWMFFSSFLLFSFIL